MNILSHNLVWPSLKRTFINPDHFFIFKNQFLFFQFSVSQFTWQIWLTNNSIKSNKPKESWIKHRCCAWVQKRVCCQWGLNSRARACHSVMLIGFKCDTIQLFRHLLYPDHFKMQRISFERHQNYYLNEQLRFHLFRSRRYMCLLFVNKLQYWRTV